MNKLKKKKKPSAASPLSRIEQETYRQRKAQNNNRTSLLSSISTDSVSTTGRLLDKLKLADSEWDDVSEISINSNSNTTVDSLINDYSILEDDTEYDTSSTEKPQTNFKCLKSILGSTKKKQSQKSAVTKALEMGKRINTVEQNASRVINRSEIRSIHLDNLIHDADSSISLYETDEETEEEDNDHSDNDNDTVDGDNDAYNKPDPLYDNASFNRLTPVETRTDGYELPFVPQTPTRSLVDSTPVNSPHLHIQLSPPNSISITPRRNIYQHKYTTSSLSNLSNVSHNSGQLDEISESFLSTKPTDDIVFNPNISKRQPLHSHTLSAATEKFETSKNSDLQDILFLNRSASVPTRQTMKHSPAPKQVLPPTPPRSQGSLKKSALGSQNSLKKTSSPPANRTSPEFQIIPNSPGNYNININNNHNNPAINRNTNIDTNMNTNNTNHNHNYNDSNGNSYNNKYYTGYQNSMFRQQQHPQQYPQQYLQQYPHQQQYKYPQPNPQQNPPQNLQQNLQQNPQHQTISPTTPTFQQHFTQQQPINPYSGCSPSNQYRSYNPQYQSHSTYNRQPNYQQTQPNLQGYQLPNQMTNQHYYPKSTKPYYKNARYGYSPQTSPQLGNSKIVQHSHSTSQSSQPNPYVNQQQGYHKYYNNGDDNELLLLNTTKKSKTYQNVDLSTIIPR